MPNAKRASLPPSPVSAAAGFASPVGATPAGAKKIDVETNWTRNAAVVLPSKGASWLVATAVKAARSLDPPFRVSFSETSTRGAPKLEVGLAELEDESKRAAVVDKIIFGFIGGRFGDIGGVAAQPRALQPGPDGGVVTYVLVDRSGAELGAGDMAMKRFLAEFPPAAAAAVAAADFDFSEFPALMVVLRDAGALAADATSLPKPDAMALLGSVAGSTLADDGATRAAAAAAEADATAGIS